MFRKVDIRGIIKDHLNTLSANAWDGNASHLDLLLFFGSPAVPAIALPLLGVWLTQAAISTLVTAVSVFGALLFNLLVLVYQIGRREASAAQVAIGDPSRAVLRRKLLQQIHSNVAFTILVALVLIVLMLPGVFSGSRLPLGVATVGFYYLGSVLVLHLLMVLKRMHILLKDEYNAP